MLSRIDLTDDESLRAISIEDRLIAAGTMTAHVAKQYAMLCIERARGYAAHLQVMQVHPYLLKWSHEMVQATGQTKLFTHHNYLPWLQAFMVVRYGEAVQHWPMSMTEDDVKRARDWKNGKAPNVIEIEG